MQDEPERQIVVLVYGKMIQARESDRKFFVLISKCGDGQNVRHHHINVTAILSATWGAKCTSHQASSSVRLSPEAVSLVSPPSQ